MPLRRSVKPKKKGRLQKVEEAAKAVCLQPADSPIIDGVAVDYMEDDSIGGSGSSSSLAEVGRTQREQQMEYAEKIIEDVEKKAREWCDAIMDENAQNIRMQQRTRDRVKNKINRKFRHMKLADLCHMSGNDFNAALLMAVPPGERATLLAEAKAGGLDTDDEDEEEEMPTVVKGKNPPRMVPATPKGGGRPAGGGRVTRSAIKGPRASARSSTMCHEAGFALGTPTGRTLNLGTAGIGHAYYALLIDAPCRFPSFGWLPTFRGAFRGAPELPESVIAQLHERFDPDCTVWQCLDIIFQPKIEGYTRHAEAVCAELRQNIAERSKQLREKIAPVDDAAGAPDKKKKKTNKAAAKPKAKARTKRGAAAASAGSEGGDVGEGSPVAMAISVSIKGGPYDGLVFEISVEEDGDARLVGRSTGKKASFLTLTFMFKNHGISLRRDSEVSITHGMFMNSGGVVTFMDNGSTNGTEVDGEWVKPKKAYKIFPGSELQIGQSHCTVAITWER
ncbi:unnamed protein product [Scytosiphon promiscuus]